MTSHADSFGAFALLPVGDGEAGCFRLGALAERGLCDPARLPFSIRILLENVLRAEALGLASPEAVRALAAYDPLRPGGAEIPFFPARVLLQDFTGVPALVDLAALRAGLARLGGDPARINPRIPVDLVVDHSVQVDHFGSRDAAAKNLEIEFGRNRERYEFLRWGQRTFTGLSVVPPASGICHQVNLEHLARVVELRNCGGRELLFPDTLVGTDSHTPMVGGLGVLGWGVGGIEAEAAMLGQPYFMEPPPVVGVRLAGRLPEGATATDLVLTVTELLRRRGVVGAFVEFCGPGLAALTVPDRATLANMAPEYGATVGFFPVDEQTLDYLRATGRPPELVERVRRYCRAQGLFREADGPEPLFQDVLELDLTNLEPSLAGPRRPQDRVALKRMRDSWRALLVRPAAEGGFGLSEERLGATAALPGKGAIGHGAVAIAAITSCTNTSNPTVMLAAGLLARKARARGLAVKPWVKTSLAPGSLAVTGYLEAAGLLGDLEALGFSVVGYGCTTCIGNSGPLPAEVAAAVEGNDLVVAAVLSGNRNFDGRINPLVKASYLASPPLVVAYALAGTLDLDLARDPVGRDAQGRPVFLAELWPTPAEVQERLAAVLRPELFRERYANIEQSSPRWNGLPVKGGALYEWDDASDYIHEPPFFLEMSRSPLSILPILGARVLVLGGDSVTTDHISPAGAIALHSPAGVYLRSRGVRPEDFNQYGARRGDDRVMTRGTFANIRLRNLLAPGTEGGVTVHLPSAEVVSIFEAAERYRAEGTPLLVIAGRDYGMGSSRDWAAKGARLLGVRAVLALSYERIHRSNLVGMGVLPLQFRPGETLAALGLTGRERFDILIGPELAPRSEVELRVHADAGPPRAIRVLCRLDTQAELEYFRHGGILQAVLRGFAGEHDGRGPRA